MDRESRGQLTKEFSELCSGLELRHGIELLEGARKRIRQAPHGSGRELRVFRFKVKAVNVGEKALGCFEFTVDERRIEDQLGSIIGDLRLAPGVNLPLHRLKVTLNAVHSDRQCIDQVKALGVLGQHRGEHAWDNVSKFGVP